MILRFIIKNFPIIAVIIAIGALLGCLFQTRRLKQSAAVNAKLKNQIRTMSEYINQIQEQSGPAIEGGSAMRPVSPPSSPIPSEPDYDPEPAYEEPAPAKSEPDEEPEPEEEPDPESEPEPQEELDADDEEPESPAPKPRKSVKKTKK